MTRRSRPHPIRQRGFALVTVLWAIALLMIMASSFSLTLQRDSRLVRYNQDRATGLALADAGVHYALMMLSLQDPHQRWRSDGTVYTPTLPGGRLRIQIFDEAGKFDINAAQEPTLKALLNKALGERQDQADALAAAILDWRDPDDLVHLNGAEETEYKQADKGWAPRNTNFQTLEELQMVLGMTPAIYRRLERVLTIYSGQDGINHKKASLEALMMLPGVDEAMARSYIEQRRATLPGAEPPFPIQIPPGGPRLTGGGDNAFTIYAQSLTDEGQLTGVLAIAKRQATGHSPYTFLSWKQVRSAYLELPDDDRSDASR
jgi:general secretion pathway protein K